MPTLADFLAHIRVVMVNTTLPANIGSAARAMHTMGLTDLVIVDPKRPMDADALAHAAGAHHLIENMRVVATLADAIGDCQWVMATSSRERHIPKAVLTPRQAASLLCQAYQQSQQQPQQHPLPNTRYQPLALASFQAAIVFGREDRGLTNDELQLANYHIQIPANPDYGVLNVAAAVQVIASYLYEVAQTHLTTNHASANNATENTIELSIRQTWDEPAITHEQSQALQAQLLALLTQLGIYDANQSKHMPKRIARLFDRLQLDVKEYQLLQAAIAKLSKG